MLNKILRFLSDQIIYFISLHEPILEEYHTDNDCIIDNSDSMSCLKFTIIFIAKHCEERSAYTEN